MPPAVLTPLCSGMAHVMPYFSSVPRFGNEVTVVVGEPLDLGAVTCRWGRRRNLGVERDKARHGGGGVAAPVRPGGALCRCVVADGNADVL
jgi:hypothetical protein